MLQVGGNICEHLSGRLASAHRQVVGTITETFEMKFVHILSLGLALVLSGCGSDDTSDDNTGDTTGGTTGGDTTGGDTTGGTTGGDEVSFTVGSYAVESQRAYATEACEGESEPSETEGNMVFTFQDGGVFGAELSACVMGEELGDAQTEEACEADGGFWFTDSVAGTWSNDGTSIDITVQQEDERGNPETDTLSCTVQSASAISCYGVETEETVDLEGNVIESIDRCLELSLSLVSN